MASCPLNIHLLTKYFYQENNRIKFLKIFLIHRTRFTEIIGWGGGGGTWNSVTFELKNAKSFTEIESKKQDYRKSLSI